MAVKYLDNAKGLNMGAAYLNDKQSREFVRFIAASTRSETQKSLQESPFVSIIMNRSSELETITGRHTTLLSISYMYYVHNVHS